MYDLEQKGTIYVTGKIGSFVSFFISQIKRKIFIFYDTDDEAFLSQEEIEYYTKKHVQLFPMYTDKVFEKEDEGKRTGFLYHLVSDEEFIGLFPYSAISHSLSSPQILFSGVKTIEPGNTIFQEDIVEYLENNGYEKTSLIRDVGEYAKRGSIIDVFPPSYEKPLRIEFLGDQILSIRLFNPDTQRSLTELKQCTLTYVNQSQADAGTTIADYLNDNIVLVHKGIASCHG